MEINVNRQIHVQEGDIFATNFKALITGIWHTQNRPFAFDLSIGSIMTSMQGKSQLLIIVKVFYLKRNSYASYEINFK